LTWAIAVHGGAGEWDEALHEKARAGVHSAASEGGSLLAGGSSALDAVTSAVTMLEDNPLFTAIAQVKAAPPGVPGGRRAYNSRHHAQRLP
jgi:isoaspartyl peptidase/L-asparaginase-like protein (Ntn-hydrolase superfamily)